MSLTMKTGAGRPTSKPRRVPDVEELACVGTGTTHQLVNSAKRGGLVTCCRGCGRSWSEIDAEERAR
jgi:hypothetical protein